MASIKLERKKGKLYLRYYHNKQKTLINTNLLVEDRYWDKKAKTLLKTLPNYNEAQYIIQDVSQKIRRAIIQLRTEGHNALPQHVKNIIYGKQVDHKNNTSFWKFFDQYVSEVKLNRKAATYINYKKLERILKKFESTRKEKIEFESINLDFYYRLQSYFKEKNYNDNYFGNNIKFLKALLNDATERVRRQANLDQMQGTCYVGFEHLVL